MKLNFEAAVAMIRVFGVDVHAADNPAPSTLNQFTMSIPEMREILENGQPETTSAFLQSLGYGLVAWEGKRRLYFKTK